MARRLKESLKKPKQRQKFRQQREKKNKKTITLAITSTALAAGMTLHVANGQVKADVVNGNTTNTATQTAPSDNATNTSATTSTTNSTPQATNGSASTSATTNTVSSAPTNGAVTTHNIGPASSTSNSQSTAATSSQPANTTTSTTSSGQGVKVNVPHNELDQVVKDAQNAGITVNRQPDTNTTVDSIQQDQKVKDIQQDYHQQAQKGRDTIQKAKAAEQAYEKAKKDYDQQVNKMKNNGGHYPSYPRKDDNGSFTESGTWTNLPPKKIGGVTTSLTGKVNSKADLTNGNVVVNIAGNDKGRVVSKIEFKEKAKQYHGTLKRGNVTVPGGYNNIGPHTDLFYMNSGSEFMLPNAVRTADGKYHDLYVKISSSNGTPVYVWNTNGAINYYFASNTIPNKNYNTATYHIGNNSNGKSTGYDKGNYFWYTVVGDIDLGQYLTSPGSWLLGMGGGLNVTDKEGAYSISGTHLGNTYGKNRHATKGLQELDSAPDGIVVLGHYGNSFEKSLHNGGNKLSWSVADADFGIAVKVNALGPAPENPNLSDFEFPYHYNNLIVNPTTEKQLQVSDGQDANNHEVMKGETVVFPVHTADLPAYRTEKTTVSGWEDTLPEGVTYKGFKVMYKGQDITNKYTMKKVGDRTYQFLANDEVLGWINADLNTKFTLPTLEIITEATVNGSHNANTATTLWNNYRGITNTVQTDIPKTTPGKQVHNDDGTDINNQGMIHNGNLDYTLVWDFSDKHNVVVSKDTVAKGLSIHDDYDETRLQISAEQKKATKVVDSSGKNITDEVNITWDDTKGMVVFSAKDPQAFLKKYSGQKLKVLFTATVKPNAKGEIVNTAVQNDFGQDYITNTVTNPIPDSEPHKSTVDNNGKDVEGKTLPHNANTRFNLVWDLSKIHDLGITEKQWAQGLGYEDDYDQAHILVDDQAKKKFDVRTADGTSILGDLNIQWDDQNGKWTITAKDAKAFVKKYGGQKLAIDFWGHVDSKSQGEFKNKATQLNFGEPFDTNETSNFVPVSKPNKEDLDEDENDIDGMTVLHDSLMHYRTNWDLTQLKNVSWDNLTDDQIKKGLTYYDDYDETRMTIGDAEKKMVYVTDDKGNSVMDDIDFAWNDDNGMWLVTAKDQKKFLEKYAGQMLHINFFGLVKADATGDILNQAFQDNWGEIIPTNVVKNHIPVVEPHKQDLNEDGTDINGMKVLPGSRLDYAETWDLSDLKNLSLSKKQLAKGLHFYDDYDETKLQVGSDEKGFFTVVDEKGNSVMNDLNLQWDDEHGKWTLSAKDPQAFLKKYAGQKLSIHFFVTVKNGVKGIIKNQAFQNNFGEDVATEIVENPVVVSEPHKKDLDVNNKDNNGKTLVRGDQVHYQMIWDTSDLGNISLTKGQILHGFSFRDDYDEHYLNVDNLHKGMFSIKSQKTGKSVLNDFDLKWDMANGTWTLTAKDPKAFAEKYAGDKLIIDFFATIKNNVEGTLKNTAFQNNAGEEVATETVENVIKKQNVHKDVVLSIGNQKSLDGAEIPLNSIFNYRLDSSIRPANYGGDSETYKWTFTDKFDTEHDMFTGIWHVETKRAIVLTDGHTIPAGTDISKYFTPSYDSATGIFTLEITKEFADLLNTDANKATEQGFSIYLQTKRIKASDNVRNFFTESYNGETLVSNTVVTHTPQPTKPRPHTPTPHTPTPTVPTPYQTATIPPVVPKHLIEQVVNKVKSEPAQKPAPQVTLPQTGDKTDEIAAAIGASLTGLGMLVSFAGTRKKRKELATARNVG